MMEVCVVHLVWAPLGTAPLERFVASYRAHPAGQEHRLVVVFKGFEDPGAVAEHAALLDGLAAESMFYDRPTFDLPTYAAAAERFDASHHCFLNSESVLLSDGWLAAMCDALADPAVGAVGATGSYERPRSRLPMRRRRWPRFPNPHLRTNAFMLPRDLVRAARWPDVSTKSRAWELESGHHGMTRQVWNRGLAALVVGRDGTAYPPHAWAASATFRSGGQANLLVADNRTRQWEDAGASERARLSRLAWGADPEATAEQVRSSTAAAAAPAPRRTARI
jgi:hypothetical protein